MLESNMWFIIIYVAILCSIVNSNYMDYDIYNCTPINGQSENLKFRPSTRPTYDNKKFAIDEINYHKNTDFDEVTNQDNDENININVTTANLKFIELNRNDTTLIHPETDLFIQLNVTFSKQSVPPNDTEELLNTLDKKDAALRPLNHLFKDNETYHLCRRLQHNQFKCYSIPMEILKPHLRQRLHKIFYTKQSKIPYLCDLTNRDLFEQSEYCKKLKMYKKTHMKLKYQSLIPTDLFDNKSRMDGLFYFCGFDNNNFDANICWPVDNTNNNSKEISYSMPILDKHIRSNTTLLCYVAKERSDTQITCWPAHYVTNESSISPNNQTYICNAIYKNDSVKLTKCWLNTHLKRPSFLSPRNDSFFCEYKTDGSLLSDFVCQLRQAIDDNKPTTKTTMYTMEDFNNIFKQRQEYHDNILNSHRVKRNSFEQLQNNRNPQVLKVKFNDIKYVNEHPNSPQLLMSLVMNHDNETEQKYVLEDDGDKYSTTSFNSGEEKNYIPTPTATPTPNHHLESLSELSTLPEENVTEDPIEKLETLIEKANFSNPHDVKQIVQNILEEVNHDLLQNRTVLHTGSINEQSNNDFYFLNNFGNSTNEDDVLDTAKNHRHEENKPKSLPAYKTSVVDTNKFDKIFFKFIVNRPSERECNHRHHKPEPIIKTKLFSFIPFTHIVHHQVVQVFPNSNKTDKAENITYVPEITAATNHTENFYTPQVITNIPNNWFNLMSPRKDDPNSDHDLA